MSNRNDCGICGKFVGFGSAVVLHYGKSGRLHPECVPVGQVTLANGSPYSRSLAQEGTQKRGIPERKSA